MGLIAILIIILGIGSIIKKLFKLNMEEASAIAIILSVVIAYIFGLLNILNFSIYFLPILAIIGIGLDVFLIIKRKIKLKELFTMPIIIYMVLLIIIYFITKKLEFSQYDEYMFWGSNLKLMCQKNLLWANSKMNGIHLTYPPFTAIFEYICCKFDLAFSETAAYFGIITLMGSFVLTTQKAEMNKKNFTKIILEYILVVLAVYMCNYYIPNLSVDCILGLMFGVTLYKTSKIKEKKDYICVIFMMIAITLTKTNGILLSGICIMNLFFEFLFKIILHKENKKAIFKKVTIIFLMLISIIVTLGTWKIYCIINGKKVDDAHDKNYVENINVVDCIKSIFGKSNLSNRNNEIAKNFLKSLIEKNILNKSFFYTAISIIIIIDIFKIIKIIAENNKIKNIAHFLSINIGFILYSFTILLVFMFVFQENQGDELLGFERYICTYILAIITNSIFNLINSINLKERIIEFVCVVTIFGGIEFKGLKINKYPIGYNVTCSAKLINKKVDENSKVFIINQLCEYGLNFMQLKYLIEPIDTNLLYEWHILPYNSELYYTLQISEDDLIKKLIDENYDYVFILYANTDFVEYYGDIIDNDDFKESFENMIELTQSNSDKRVKNVQKLFRVNKEKKKIE